MTVKLLLIDNYDSFTYNLVQYFQELGRDPRSTLGAAQVDLEVTVKKNDQITVAEAIELKPDYLVFSPGPGTVTNPQDVGVMPALLAQFRGKIPILGVCLGHQLIGQAFGGQIVAVEPQHGKQCVMKVLDKSGLFKNFNDTFTAMRYHSLVVVFDPPPTGDGLPAEPSSGRGAGEDLKVTAVTNDEHQHLMAFEKPDEKLYSVQFHPESVGTKCGMAILQNFLDSTTAMPS